MHESWWTGCRKADRQLFASAESACQVLGLGRVCMDVKRFEQVYIHHMKRPKAGSCLTNDEMNEGDCVKERK